MRAIALQFNPWMGAVEENAARCESLIRTHGNPQTLLVFPELTLIGYPPRDLLAFSALRRTELEALSRLQKLSAELQCHILIGHTEANPSGSRGLFNAASILSKGERALRVLKRRLPAYDVFEEERFFDPGPHKQESVWECFGMRIRVAICEDDWPTTPAHSFRDLRRYPKSVEPEGPVDLHINLSASPFQRQKHSVRRDLMYALALRSKCAVLYVNTVGGQEDLVFDGRSFLISADGDLVGEGPAWDEAVVIFEGQVKGPKKNWSSPQLSSLPMDTSEDLRRALVVGIRDFVKKSGFSKVVLGLSGGVDSALVAALAAEALGPENVLGVSLPSPWTSSESMEEAKDLAQRLNIELRQISIESSFKAVTASLNSELSGLTLENLQSRIRGVLLMSLANNERRLLLATSNKAELACGYSTLYGDMCGALMPIGDLYKTEVYELAHHIAHRDLELGRRERIPLRTRQRAPTAELKPNQRDSDSLPDYAWLDLFVRHYIEGAGRIVGDLDFWNRVFMPTHSVDSLCRTIEGAEFKRRQAPPILKVHTRSFGHGWHLPQVKKNLARLEWE